VQKTKLDLKKLLVMCLGPMGAALIAFLTLPIMARIYRPNVVAQYSIFISVTTLVTSLIGFELYQNYVREYYHHVKELPKFVASNFAPILVSYPLFVVALVFYGDRISDYMKITSFTHFSIYLGIAVLLGVWIQIASHIVRMEGTPLQFSISLIVPKLCFLFFILLIGGMNEGAASDFLIIALLVAAAIGSAYYSFICRKYSIMHCSRFIDLLISFYSIKFAFPLLISGLLTTVPIVLDRLILAHYGSMGQVAVYTIVTSIAGAVSLIAAIVANLWHPWIYRKYSEGTLTLPLIQSLMTLASLGISIMWSLSWIAASLVHLFLPDYYSSVTFLLGGYIASPLLLLFSDFTVVGIALKRQTIFIFIAGLVGCAVSILFFILLIPQYLASGAVASIVTGSLGIFLIRTEFSSRLLGGFSRWRIYFLVTLYFSQSLFILFAKTGLITALICAVTSVVIVIGVYASQIKPAIYQFQLSLQS